MSPISRHLEAAIWEKERDLKDPSWNAFEVLESNEVVLSCLISLCIICRWLGGSQFSTENNRSLKTGLSLTHLWLQFPRSYDKNWQHWKQRSLIQQMSHRSWCWENPPKWPSSGFEIIVICPDDWWQRSVLLKAHSSDQWLTCKPCQDDLESDEEQKSLEEAVRRYEKAAGLISDAAGTKSSKSLRKTSLVAGKGIPLNNNGGNVQRNCCDAWGRGLTLPLSWMNFESEDMWNALGPTGKMTMAPTRCVTECESPMVMYHTTIPRLPSFQGNSKGLVNSNFSTRWEEIVAEGESVLDNWWLEICICLPGLWMFMGLLWFTMVFCIRACQHWWVFRRGLSIHWMVAAPCRTPKAHKH